MYLWDERAHYDPGGMSLFRWGRGMLRAQRNTLLDLHRLEHGKKPT